MAQKQYIRDFYGRELGYIETQPNGDQTAFDFYHHILGFYYAKSNHTEDFYHRKIASGNVLSGLIYSAKNDNKF